MQSKILASRQSEELNKSIIAYLSANELSNAAATLREELGIGEDAFDAFAARRYEPLLSRKWTSTLRLQKKIMELEAQNVALQSELEKTKSSSLSRNSADPDSWLPKSTARHSLESHQKTINCIAFHPIFLSIASGSDDFTIKIWDWELGELENTLKGHTRAVTDVDYGGPKGSVLLASCSSDLTIKIWNPTDDYKNIRTLLGHDHSIHAVRFIPSEIGGTSLLVSASTDKNLKIWDVANGYCVKTLQGHTSRVRDVFPSFDGRFLLSTGDDMRARLWDISTPGTESTATMVGHENFNECCAIAPPSSYRYFALLAGLKKTPSINSSAEYMATGSRDKTIKLWNAQGSCLATLVGHDNWVRALVFHPSGRYLLSVSDDKTLRCWDLSQGGICIKVISDAHDRFITCLKWAPGIIKSLPERQVGDDVETPEDTHREAGNFNLQNRCVIATGGVDCKLRIFTD